MTDLPCHVVFSKPAIIDGVFHRGFVTTDRPLTITDQLQRELWSVGIFFHTAIEPFYNPMIELYFASKTFRNCPHPRIDITDRDLTDERVFFPIADTEPEFDVVFNAVWMPIKRQELFFDALKWSQQEGRPVKALWFGYHYEESSKQRELDFKAAVEEQQLDVTFLETDFDTAEVNRRFNLAKSCVICSRSEGGPRVLAESLFADVPFIVTEDTLGGAPETIRPETGVICPPTGPGIARAIWEVCDDLDRFSPRRWAVENLTRRSTVARLQEKLREISESRSSKLSPINWQQVRFTEYDWVSKKQLVRKAEQEFLATESKESSLD